MKLFYKKYRDIFQMETLTRTQKDIITILINRAEFHKNNPFYCYESWIAQEVKCSEKTVKRAIKHFAEIGLLDIDRPDSPVKRIFQRRGKDLGRLAAMPCAAVSSSSVFAKGGGRIGSSTISKSPVISARLSSSCSLVRRLARRISPRSSARVP